MEYKKNDIVPVTIEDIGNDGEGIGKADGYTLFVKDAVIGDVIEARITKCKKNYGYARVEKVVTPSPFRVEPKCPFHRQCGGCQMQAMQYERQLIYKQDKVRANLLRVGGFTPEEIDAAMEPIVEMQEPWHYRNKAQYPVGYDKAGNLVAGFYAGRTHDIIANTNCVLGPPENQMILETILSYMRENQVSAYREATGEGLVRHVLIRTGFASGEIMVCLVINGKRLPAEEKLVERLRGLRLADIEETENGKQIYAEDSRRRQCVKKITSISVNVNTEKTNVIMGQEIRVLWGSECIRDSLRVLHPQDFDKTDREENERISFSISPLSFYQVNPRQTERLYGLALEYAGLTGKETVWDLYCGIGTISLFMAKQAKQVYGVEVVPQAVEDARENARRNQILNVEFYVGKAEEVLPAFYKKIATDGNEGGEADKRHPDVIVVDPPRKGCDEKCLETMLRMQPERIVYVSCDSATLARDLKVLCGGGYTLKRLRAVDQFGHTCHTECVCLIEQPRET
ncbi:MAG: 23S rRNA (uracil(1939)-C(5))-methyltransferase RlmD [Eubacterium sp.]|nr:23S rRNA (uracil(1939)-C(5))-methyltransferase RlmD [Eubacterium sp.]